MKQWTIFPVDLGRLVRDKAAVVYFRDPGTQTDLAVVAWLLVSGSEKILVDTGPSLLSETFDFHRPFYQVPEQTLKYQLQALDTSLDEIKVVINTHLHWDHCYQNSLFKGARFIVQKRELEFAGNPVPVHARAYDTGMEGFKPPFEGLDFEVIEGDIEVASGIRVLLTPGHTPGMQTVCVETSKGLYILAGDTIPLFENIIEQGKKDFLPNGIYVDLLAYYESLERINSMGGTIVPGHDPLSLNQALYQ